MIVMIEPLNWADVVNDYNEMQKRLQQSVTIDPNFKEFYSQYDAFHNVVFQKINEIIEDINKITTVKYALKAEFDRLLHEKYSDSREFNAAKLTIMVSIQNIINTLEK